MNQQIITTSLSTVLPVLREAQKAGQRIVALSPQLNPITGLPYGYIVIVDEP